MLHAISVVGLTALTVGGYVAGVPLLESVLPVSPILVGAVLVTLMIAIRPRGEPAPWRMAWIVGAYYLLLSAGFIFAAPSAYGLEKSLQMATLVPLSIWGGMVLLRTQRARSLWLIGTVLVAVLTSSLVYLSPDTLSAQLGRLSIEGSNTIAAGRATAAGVVVLTVLALTGTKHRILLLVAAAGFAMIMLASGARGPFVASLLAISLVFAIVSTRGKWLWGVAALLSGVFAWQWAVEQGYYLERLTLVGGASVTTRVDLYATALNHAIANPWGTGWGSMVDVYASTTSLRAGSHSYPHNILLELAAEGGVIALAGFVALVVLAWRTQRKRASIPVETAMLALFIFFLVSAMVSGDAPSQRALWAMCGACLTPLISARSIENTPSDTARNSGT